MRTCRICNAKITEENKQLTESGKLKFMCKNCWAARPPAKKRSKNKE